MTYVTGQPILFVGCGQVRLSSLSLHFFRRETKLTRVSRSFVFDDADVH